MADFSKFDSMVDFNELGKSIEEASKNMGDYPEVEPGEYTVKLAKLELSETKDHRPMIKGQFKILEGKFKNYNLFYNRTIYGTKNDGNMIASALGFLKSLEPSDEVGPIEFKKYSQFADLLLDITEDCADELNYKVKYDPEAFNSIKVIEVIEV